MKATKEELIAAIQRCVELATDRPLPHPLNPQAGQAAMVRMQLLDVDKAAEADLSAILQATPGLELMQRGMMWGAGQGWAVTGPELPKWTTMRALDVGPCQTADELLQFAATNGCNASDYLAVAGITVASEVALGHGLSVVPFDQVPRGQATDRLTGVDMVLPPPNSVSFNAENSPPTALIRRQRWIEPLVVPWGDGPPHRADFTLLFDCALALSLLGPNIVLERSFWTWLPESVPMSTKQGGGAHPLHEIQVPHYQVKPLELTEEKSSVVQGFLSLTEETRGRLRLPLSRLRLSLMRRSIVDQAVELGIAFEALLIGGETKNDLVDTGKNRLAVLGGGTAQERERNMSLYDGFYDVRSQSVHTGVVDVVAQRKVKHQGKLSAEQVLGESQVLCRDLISRVIEQGDFPDWSKIFPKAKDVALLADLGEE